MTYQRLDRGKRGRWRPAPGPVRRKDKSSWFGWMRASRVRAGVQMHCRRSLHPAFYTCCWAGRRSDGSLRAATTTASEIEKDASTSKPVCRPSVYAECVSSRPASALFARDVIPRVGDYFAIVDLARWPRRGWERALSKIYRSPLGGTLFDKHTHARRIGVRQKARCPTLVRTVRGS